MADSGLEKFGKLLMQKVRDEAIEDWEKELDGRMKGIPPDNVKQMLRSLHSLPEETKRIFAALIPGVVDAVLHHFLWQVEQRRELHLGMETAEGVEDLREASDGLPGELYSDEGWVARFSKKPRFF